MSDYLVLSKDKDGKPNMVKKGDVIYMTVKLWKELTEMYPVNLGYPKKKVRNG